MTAKEKQILENIIQAIPKMSDSEKERLLIFGEAISMICDRPNRQTEEEKKGA